jgi:malate dehydrogenase (oxaloacetate-decarboxylating)(NADP+)
VEILQEKYPDWNIDGEMQVNIALDKELRDKKYPFSRLNGMEVNTLIFPCLNTANTTYKMLQALTSDVEIIGPIQMGLNKPIHFIDFESTVEDIVNVTAVAAIDAMANKERYNE